MLKVTIQDLREELEARNTVYELDKLLIIVNNLPLDYGEAMELLHAIVAKKNQLSKA
jgi:hypothetical protein